MCLLFPPLSLSPAAPLPRLTLHSTNSLCFSDTPALAFPSPLAPSAPGVGSIWDVVKRPLPRAGPRFSVSNPNLAYSLLGLEQVI